ncbi:MAG TPA: hypothetical protein VNG33_15675, partial [Polyangiaceae bacterium]|nr:hypothetical protein [Polyangiaceae bacterium]
REMEIDYSRLKAAHLLRIHMVRVCTTFERGLCALSAIEDGGDRLELLRLATSCAHELLGDRPGYAAPMGRYLFACLHALSGEREQALEQLDLAIAGLSRFDMGYLANCAKARRGALGGGEAGRALLEASSERLRDQGVVNVARCLDMSAPGFSRSPAG